MYHTTNCEEIGSSVPGVLQIPGHPASYQRTMNTGLLNLRSSGWPWPRGYLDPGKYNADFRNIYTTFAERSPISDAVFGDQIFIEANATWNLFIQV